jgi:type IV pilus assembly protein PilN
MPRINLLPWREAHRAEKQRQFFTVLGASAIATGLAIVLVHVQFSALIDTQNARNRFLEGEIRRVEKEIAEIKTLKEDKKALLARMNVIQKLQSSRPEIVHLFEEISLNAPRGVYLEMVSRKGNVVSMEGYSNSNDSVSAFMRQLDASPWLQNPKLNVIESKSDNLGNKSYFKLEVTQEVPKADVPEDTMANNTRKGK